MTNHATYKITEVTKIKDFTHIIKVTCQHPHTVEKILEHGINIFHTRITPSQCEIEHFIPLTTFFKCYQVEDHFTQNCKTPTNKCSECGSTQHTHQSCTSEDKHCINCPPNNNNHRTLAAVCPYRKQKQKDKENKQKQTQFTTQEQTYANIVQKLYNKHNNKHPLHRKQRLCTSRTKRT